MGNPFVHVELMSNDVGNAKAFYGRLFDWKFEEMPMSDGSYTMIKVGEGTGGGLMKNPIPGASSAWLAYVLVSDIKSATAKARSLGATVMKDVTEVPGAGSLSIITDPTGDARALAAQEGLTALSSDWCSIRARASLRHPSVQRSRSSDGSPRKRSRSRASRAMP